MSKEALEQWLGQMGAMRLLQGFSALEPDAAMFVVDEKRTILYWSPQAESLLGYSAEDAQGEHCRKVNRCMECMVGCPLSEQKVVRQQALELYDESGASVALRKTGFGFFDEEGEFLGGIEWLTPAPVMEPAAVVPQAPSEAPVAKPPQVQGQAQPSEAMEPVSAEPARPEPAHPESAGPESAGPESAHPESARPEPRAPRPRPPRLTDDEAFEQLGDLVTREESMRDIFRTIRNISETDASVFIHGESGTGKELVARAIHQTSPRQDGPFVAVNCAALAPQLLESELFGHVKGAFTGAVSRRMGLFQRAEGGTIFLDEIAELPLDLQSKLLRVLEEREVVPVGSSTPIKVDIRVLSASFKSLPQRAREGLFREDLMYRLRVVPIALPPLRDRSGDLELLVWHFIAHFNRIGPRRIEDIESVAWDALSGYDWPGNIRELKNCMEYVFAVGRGSTLLRKELPQDLLSPREPVPIRRASTSRKASEEEEKRRIQQALERSHGHIGQAAQDLGVSRATLWRKRRKYGI